MKKMLYFSLLAGAILLVLAASPDLANASHSWANYHWARAANPLALDIGDNVDATWDSHFDEAVADWDKSSVLDLTTVPGTAKGKCRPTDGMVEVCNDSYGNNGWLGLAQIWVSGEHITQGIAKVNDTYFSSAPYNTPEWRQLVMCQEIGHDFGLDHQDEDFYNEPLGTCMDYSADPVPNQHPDQHDYDQLESIYAHLDGGSGGGGDGNCPPRNPHCGNGSPPGQNFDTPAEWGQLVRSQGRIAVYENNLGFGYRIITFVIWAD